MAPLAALLSVLVVAASPAAAGGGAVRVVSEMAECPAPHEVQSALRQVLGEGGQTAGGWTLWYGRDPGAPTAEAGLLMELAGPTGERLVSRRIPTPAGECAAIGMAMAAVVERSLRDLGWSRGEPLPESAPQPFEETPTASPDETGAPKPGVTTAGDRIPRLVLGAGPAFGTSSRLGLNLLVDARVRVEGPFCVRMGTAVLAGKSRESVPSSGNRHVSLSSRTFMVSPLAAFLAGPVELEGGPMLWLAADQASSDLPRADSGTRLVMAVGAGIGAALPLGRRWRVGLDLQGVRVAFAPDTYVDWNGSKTKVLAPSPWQGLAAAKLEFVPWP